MSLRLKVILMVLCGVALSGASGYAQVPAARTANPHGPLKFACEDCHSAVSWRPIRAVPEFDHNRDTEYPLRGMHNGVQCANCHVNPAFKSVGATCASCHADIHRRQFGPNCETCHTVQGWSVGVQAVRQHANRFPLVGAHGALECAACHKGAAGGTFTGLSTTCVSCHMKDYDAARSLDHKASRLPTTCDTCHTMNRWRGAKFDHNAATRFSLTGAHASVECATCHVGGKFVGTPTRCEGCHINDFNKATNPDHRAAKFSTTCETCHTGTSKWRGAKFDHAASTRFALTGGHSALDCASCHANGRFTAIPMDCFSCHSGNFSAVKTPNHVALGYSHDCVTCHTTAQWKGATFDHSRTKFPLTGVHATTTCIQCHADNKFAGTPTDCVSCHVNDFNRTTSPNHVASGFSQNCVSCHTTTQWKGAGFDHSRTRFPLTGAHSNATCTTCHVNGSFTGLATTCVSCHITQFNATKAPGHVAAGFSQDCGSCHSVTQWQGAKFDHTLLTKFPLTGAHLSATCAQCHVGNKFAGTPKDCVSCHLNDFNRTVNPNHVAAGFPQTCATCHTTTQFKGAKFDHTAMTKFPLSGAHSTVSCVQCHAGNRFAGTPTTCVSCHLQTFNGTKNPNHVAAGFPTDCSTCHATARWTPASFDHSRTKFALTGAHVTVLCAACHVNGKFAGLGSSCVGCHLARYAATTNPNHAAAGFPQDCAICHTTTQFAGAKFDHNTTRFPLMGRHTTVQCASCHVGNKFAGTPTDCYSCHSKEYTSVTNPNHVAAGFPKTCQTCHGNTAWTGATFSHTKFPIYSGKHAGKWSTCADCHTNSTNYTVFSCTNCHTHAQSTTDSKHRNIRGYIYNSQNCYSCHPKGSS